MITLNEDQIEILGKPNFACTDLATLLFESGTYEKTSHKTEHAQAAVIHWMNAIYEEFGNDWRKQTAAEINRLVEIIKAKSNEAEKKPLER